MELELRTDLAKDAIDISYWYFEWYVIVFGIITIGALIYHYYKYYMNIRCDVCKNIKTTRHKRSTNMSYPKTAIDVVCTMCGSEKTYYE